MTFSVCIDAGKFDILLYESSSKVAAKIYAKKLVKLSHLVKIKRTGEVRRLKERFSNEDICTSITI